MVIRKALLIGFIVFLTGGCTEEPVKKDDILIQLSAARVGTVSILNDPDNVPFNKPLILTFSVPINPIVANEEVKITDSAGGQSNYSVSYLDGGRTISISFDEDLHPNTGYQVVIGKITGIDGGEFAGLTLSFTTLNETIILEEVTIDGLNWDLKFKKTDVAFEPEIKVRFSHPLNASRLSDNFKLFGGNVTNSLNFDLSGDNRELTITPQTPLPYYTKYTFRILNNDLSADQYEFESTEGIFYTKLDNSFKFPEISDEELLTKIQEQTFKYFWDFGHPVSGLARERNTSGETVTIGGSGFGVMSILVGIERGFITRAQGIERLSKIVGFLGNEADRFHGVWPHWMNGTTGVTRPFSAKDDGADLVESAFMIQGLLTVREYLNSGVPEESDLIDSITTLWEEVEWDWFTKGGEDVLYWHWSPNFNWEMNLPVRGYNEGLIVYVLAASSPTHPIDAEVYHAGWARSGGILNGNSYYGITLPVGYDFGGPLFFSHYSFLGLDPRNLSDQYANYWEQNVNHSLINNAYCIQNPLGYVGYSEDSWGLTASDNHVGYSAHSPTNDKGVITPTAALSSIPYTPLESMKAIRHFYYILGDRLWGEYGFYDAFNVNEGWYASSTLAIDQGPIICMIENHRTALLWDLFMTSTEVQNGLTSLDISYE